MEWLEEAAEEQDAISALDLLTDEETDDEEAPEVRSAECGVRSAKCGMPSAECGMRSAK